MSHIEYSHLRSQMTSSILNVKTINSTTCVKFKKKCENAVSAIENVIIMPSLLSFRHEMDKNRSQCLRKIIIKFSLIKKINLGVAYALFHP